MKRYLLFGSKSLSILIFVMLPVTGIATTCNNVFDALRANEWFLPRPLGEKTVTRIYVTEIGNGPTVVVLHGGFGDDYSYLVDAFEPLFKKYRFVFYDQRGSLRSPVKDNDYEKYITFQAHIDDLEALRQALHAKKMLIVAHSMGTLIAQAYLAQHPDNVEGLVLLGALPPKTPTGETLDVLSKGMNERAGKMWQRKAVAEEMKAEGLWNGPYTPQQDFRHAQIIEAGANIVHIERWRSFRANSFYNRKAGEAAYKTAPQTYNFLKDMGRCHCWITIIDGDHDYVDPGGRVWKQYASELTNVVVKSLPDAGHSAWIDDPERFETDINNAFERALKE